MADTILQLGDFVFSAYEIPESITFGGEQKLAVHKLPGGVRVVQAMGRDDASLSWSGLMFGSGATDRAKYLDYLRVQGKQLLLTWADFKYTVVIESFHATYQRKYQIPYQISCCVVTDQTNQTTKPVESGFDKAIWGDNNTAQTLGTQINDPTLSSLLATMDAAINSVSTFANQTTATINSILKPVSAVMQRVQYLQSSVGNTMINVGSLGGIVPNSSVAHMASRMASQMNVTSQSTLLSQLGSVTGRISTNLNVMNTGGTSPKQVKVAGGTYYDTAAQQYGDASKGMALAQVNGSADMNISGIQDITLPSNLA
jgi:hypothetical protein